MASRWERLLDQKPIPLTDHLLTEVAKLLVKDLTRWPLPVEELDLATGQRFAQLLSGELPRPREAVYGEAFRLARWEISRELEAYDEYMRNRRFLERGLTVDDKPALLLVSRWLEEQLLGLGEATQGRIRRPQLLVCLERMERALRPSPPLN